MILLVIAVLAVVVAVIFMQQALRKIPIQYAKRAAVGRTQSGGQSTHLPLKVNAAGVIPVIFATAFIITPRTIMWPLLSPSHIFMPLYRLILNKWLKI